MIAETFLTTEEVLEYLQVNLRTVYRLIKAGKIPAVRVGRQWRFRKRDIDNWLNTSPASRGRGGDRAGLSERPALERRRAAEYDLLITDLKMPGMDGLSVIREARRIRPDVAVVIITGYSTEASAIEAINLGVAGYLTKTFRLPRILAATARALGEPVPAAEAGA